MTIEEYMPFRSTIADDTFHRLHHVLNLVLLLLRCGMGDRHSGEQINYLAPTGNLGMEEGPFITLTAICGPLCGL